MNIKQLDALEGVAVDIAAKIAPWLAPIPTAVLVSNATVRHLGWSKPVGVVAGVTVELLGLSATVTALELYQYNGKKRKTDPRAPFGLAAALAVMYFVVATGLTVLLDVLPGLAPFAPAIFPALSLVAVTVLALRLDHRRRVETIERERQEVRERNRAAAAKRSPGAARPVDTSTRLVDKAVDKVDTSTRAVDKLVDNVDKRPGMVDKAVDKVDNVVDSTAMPVDMSTRQVDKQPGLVDKPVDKVDKRTGVVDKPVDRVDSVVDSTASLVDKPVDTVETSTRAVDSMVDTVDSVVDMSTRSVDTTIDPVDKLLIDLFRAKPGLTMAEAGRETGLTRQAVFKRLNRLEADGLIHRNGKGVRVQS